MYQEKEKQKKYRMAKLHEMVVNARGRGLPGKLAELGALCVAIGAGIWAAHHGQVVIVSVVIMFFVYSIVLQIFSRIVFLTISLITLPAYRIYIKRSQRYDWYQNYQKTYYKYHSESKQNKNYESNSQNNQNSDSKSKDYNETSNACGTAEAEARALFGLNETFTSEELKSARNRELKKCHPDQNVNGNHTKEDEERAKKVNLAYEVLKDKTQEKQTA